MKAGVGNEVAADDITGDKEMAQMFSQDDEQGRHDHHDGTDIKFRLIERRQGKPRYFLNVGQVDDPHEEGQDITGNDPDKDRDDADEAAAEDGRQNGTLRVKVEMIIAVSLDMPWTSPI